MRPSSVEEFEVVDREGIVYAVNLEEHTCSCRRWQAHEFICPHGIAACRERNLPVENFISKFYSTEYLRATYTQMYTILMATFQVGLSSPRWRIS